MQLTKSFSIAIVLLSLFPSASISATKQAKQPTRSTIIERRFYDGDLPSFQDNSAESSTEENPESEPGFCETKPSNGQSLKLGAQRIDLHYVRDAKNIETILGDIKDKLELNNLEIYRRGEIDNEIILHGAEAERKCAHRIVAAIDLPRPGINLQMWGIQISTDKSSGQEALNEVMPEVRDRINLTQQLVRDTFAVIQSYASEQITSGEIDDDFQEIIEAIRYERLFNLSRPLSLLDIVIIANSSKDPLKFNQHLFGSMMKVMKEDSRYKPYLEAMREKERPPFEGFFRSRGLKPECVAEKHSPQESEKEADEGELVGCRNSAKNIENGHWKWTAVDDSDAPLKIAQQGRRLMLEFGLQYGDFISNPHLYDPYQLQHTSDALNGRLQDTTNAIQKDIEEFFMLPTLNEIQQIVSEEKSVSYAQLGRTTAATLSGVETKIGTNSVSAFDVTPALKLSDLLSNATKLQGDIGNFLIPTEDTPEADTAKQIAVDGALPAVKFAALLAAFAEREPELQELDTGISLTFTPNVLRDLSSSELKINLEIADPVAAPTEQQGVKPLSRIGIQTVDTTVYTQAIDFFALSTFSNQSTLDGGRGYVPIVGQVWRGIFSAIPVFGDLFSWQRPPQNVQHESLLLTNSFITPTSMGLALLYPTSSNAYEVDKFCNLQANVETYIAEMEDLDSDDRANIDKNWRNCNATRPTQFQNSP